MTSPSESIARPVSTRQLMASANFFRWPLTSCRCERHLAPGLSFQPRSSDSTSSSEVKTCSLYETRDHTVQDIETTSLGKVSNRRAKPIAKFHSVKGHNQSQRHRAEQLCLYTPSVSPSMAAWWMASTSVGSASTCQHVRVWHKQIHGQQRSRPSAATYSHLNRAAYYAHFSTQVTLGPICHHPDFTSYRLPPNIRHRLEMVSLSSWITDLSGSRGHYI